MKKAFCPYCGEPIENGCECEQLAAEDAQKFIEDYECNPMVQEGWRQQDLIDMYRRER